MDLSFSGAGFMGCYYFGVVNCWNKYIPRDRVRRVAGASAGSLIAAYYLMDLPLDNCLNEIIEMTEDIRRRPLGVFDRSNQVVDVLPRKLDLMFPPDAHKRVSGRLFVCMTRLKDMKTVIVNEFETRKDLIDALNCSCFIPVWSGNHVSTYKGVKYIDGGFTNNLPVFDEHTIRICCFSGGADIAPYDRTRSDLMSTSVIGTPVNLNWKNLRRAGRALWPPPPNFIIELLERGFHDAKSFILSNDLIQCDKCFQSTELEFQPIYSKITPTISPAVSPSVSRANSYMNLANLSRSNSFRRQRTKAANQANNDDDNNDDGEKQKRKPNPTTLATIRQLERMLDQEQGNMPSMFGGDRSKSGKQIKLKSLEQVALASAKERKSFARKLRDRLTRVTSNSSSTSPHDDSGKSSPSSSTDKHNDVELDGNVPLVMPTIVVEEATTTEAANLQQNVAGVDERHELDSPAPTIEEIMRQDSGGEELEESKQEMSSLNSVKLHHSRSSSSASSSSDGSVDSAIGGLRSKTPAGATNGVDLAAAVAAATSTVTGRPLAMRRASHSPSEKFLASRKMSLAASQLLNSQEETSGGELSGSGQGLNGKSLMGLNGNNSLLPDRFAFVPSQLPSCPPSPNLNRHCSECIRLRQQARMDGLDESIKAEAAKFGAMESSEPEKEFNGLRQRLTGWLRGQFGRAPKYSYEFYDTDEDGETDEARPPPQSALDRRRPSEIPTS